MHSVVAIEQQRYRDEEAWARENCTNHIEPQEIRMRTVNREDVGLHAIGEHCGRVPSCARAVGIVFRDRSDDSARKMAPTATTAPPRPNVLRSPIVSPASPAT